MKIVILIWLHMNAYGIETREEFVMPNWDTCVESVKSAKIQHNHPKESITIFCAYK